MVQGANTVAEAMQIADSVDAAVWMANRSGNVGKSTGYNGGKNPGKGATESYGDSGVVPMDLGVAAVSNNQGMSNVKCFLCGERGHIRRNCPKRQKA